MHVAVERRPHPYFFKDLLGLEGLERWVGG